MKELQDKAIWIRHDLPGYPEAPQLELVPYSNTQAQPVLLISMFEHFLKEWAFPQLRRDQEAGIFRASQKLAQVAAGLYVDGERMTNELWDVSPVQRYRTPHDYVTSLSPEEVANHLWLTISGNGQKWTRAFVVPAPSLEQALQLVTLCLGSEYSHSVGVALPAAAKWMAREKSRIFRDKREP